jgi:hypothetical protein
MTSHKKNSNNKPTKAAAATVPPPTTEQKEEQEIDELLQIYAPERRESMREQIRQRKRDSIGKNPSIVTS